MAGRRRPGRAPFGHAGFAIAGRLVQQRRYRAQYALGPDKPAFHGRTGDSCAATDIAVISVEVSACGVGGDVLQEAIRPMIAAPDGNRKPVRVMQKFARTTRQSHHPDGGPIARRGVGGWLRA
jgi:hypothetical protein